MVVAAAIPVLTMVSALITVTVRVGGNGPPPWRNCGTKHTALNLADILWQQLAAIAHHFAQPFPPFRIEPWARSTRAALAD